MRARRAAEKALAATSGLPGVGESFRDCADCPVMVVVPPGQFMMGTEPAEITREKLPDINAIWEQPRHAVAVRAAFAVGKYHAGAA